MAQDPQQKHVLLTEQEMAENLKRLADDILSTKEDLAYLAIVGVHTGGATLAYRLKNIIQKKTGIDVPIGVIDITLYRDDWTRISYTPIVKSTELPFSIDDKDVLLVDDVIFTGRTVRAAMDALIDFGRPKNISLAVLVDRGGRELPICADFVALKREVSSNQTVNVYLKENSSRDEVVVEGKLN